MISEGINFYIFISAIVFAAGLYVILSSKNSVRILAGILLLFSGSLINIAAISGAGFFNPEGQIILYLISGTCILNISAGVILCVTHYKKYLSNNITPSKIIA